MLMVEKTVATIIDKSLAQTPKFSGKSNQNVEDWLQDLPATFCIAEITEPQALKIISTFLDGPIKEWYTENSATSGSWATLKIFFTPHISLQQRNNSHRIGYEHGNSYRMSQSSNIILL